MDAIFLASTTGAFLNDPNDAAATAARRNALLDFVQGRKRARGITRPATRTPGRARGYDEQQRVQPAAPVEPAAAGVAVVRPPDSSRSSSHGKRRENNDQRLSKGRVRCALRRLVGNWTRQTPDVSARRTSHSDSPVPFSRWRRRRQLHPTAAGVAPPRRGAPATRTSRRQPSSVPTTRSVLARVQQDDRWVLQVALEPFGDRHPSIEPNIRSMRPSQS